MIRNRFLSLVLLIVAALVASAGGQETPARFFTDTSGKFRVKATIADLNETHVKLRKLDGQEVTIPIAKLSEADQTFLNQAYSRYKEMVGDFPIGTKVEIFSTGGWHPGVVLNVQPGKYFIKFDKYSENWNKWVTVDQLRLSTVEASSTSPSVSPAMKSDVATSNAAPPVTAAVPVREKYSGPPGKTLLERAASIDLGGPLSAAFAFEPDPLPTIGQSLPVPATIEIKTPSVGNPALVVFDPTMKYLAIDPVNFASSAHEVTILGIDAPNQRSTLMVPSGQSFAGVEDEATSAFIKSSVTIGNATTPIYQRFQKFAGASTMEMASVSTWVPGVDHVIQETFLMNHRLLARKLTEIGVWDLDSRTPQVRIQVGAKVVSAASGTGRYLACFNGKDAVVIVDLLNSSLTHRITLDGWEPLAIGFSPSGRSLAITGPGRGEVHDLPTGERLHEYGLTSASSGELGLAWIGDRYLVLQGATIVDLQTGQPVWQLPFHRQPLLQYDENTIGEVSGTGSLLQVHWLRLPVEKVMGIAYSDPTGGIPIPRNAVATVDVSGLQHSVAEVKSKLEGLVESSGYRLGAGGILEIRLSSTVGKPTKILLKDFLRTSADAEANYTSASVTAEMLLNGKSIYKRTRDYGTHLEKSTVRLMAGETAQQAVTRLTTPSVEVMAMVPVPYAGGTYHPPSNKPLATGSLRELMTKLSK